MSRATFFLSTGRCGTQWFAAHVQRIARDRARVEHEPLPWEYQPRRMLAAGAEPSAEARTHLEAVRAQLADKPYIECGHPCWSSLSWISRMLEGQVQIVHLVRAPLPTAASWVARGAFIPPILPHVPERVLISPFDDGVAFSEYRERWQSLLPFEKCLVYWAEVQTFALRLHEVFRGPWMTLRYEDFFGGGEPAALLRFLALPEDPAFAEARSVRVDMPRPIPESPCEPRLLEKHPRIVDLARALGY
jgi:hypothetical protein